MATASSVQNTAEMEAGLVDHRNCAYGWFRDRSRDSLNAYRVNWNDYTNPRSHILPPAFQVNNPELSDATFDRCNTGEREPNISLNHKKAQRGNEAERQVYEAFHQLARNGTKAPFLCFHSLDIQWMQDNAFMRNSLRCDEEVWNKWAQEGIFKQYDFIYIGRETGIGNIEVKANPDAKFDQFLEKGLKQLEKGRKLFEFLEQVTGVSLPDKAIKSILVLPNLGRKEFDQGYGDWLKTLDSSKRILIKQLRLDVEIVFKDDSDVAADNNDTYPGPNSSGSATTSKIGNYPFYNALKNILESGTSIPNETYDIYAAILAGFLSFKGIEFKIEFLCNYHAALSESRRIPDEKPQAPKQAAASNRQRKQLPSKERKKLKEEIERHEKACALYLNKDQEKALTGPNRQIILGAAGTGKTIVLLEKIKDLLAKGQCVTVYAPRSYFHKYESLRDKGYPGQLVVKELSYQLIKEMEVAIKSHYGDRRNEIYRIGCDYILFRLRQSSDVSLAKFIEDLAEKFIREHGEEFIKLFENIFGQGHIIIDDTVDHNNASLRRPYNLVFGAIFISKLAKLPGWTEKVFWVAIDPYNSLNNNDNHLQMTLSKMVRKHLSNNNANWMSFFTQIFSPAMEASLKSIGDSFYKEVVNELFSHQNHESADYTVTILTQVMRCCRKVYAAAYTDALASGNWHELVKPRCGHGIDGCSYDLITLDCPDITSAEATIWAEVENQLSIMVQCIQVINGNVAIVVSTCETCPLSLRDWLKAKFRDSGKPAWSPGSEEMPDEVQQSLLAIENWNSVSSLEWPIVIYVSCFPKGYEIDHAEDVKYQRYRALTRAKSKVIEIRASYGM